MDRPSTGQSWDLHSISTHGKCIEVHWMMDKTSDMEGTHIWGRCSVLKIRTKPLAIMRYSPFSDSMSLLVKRNWTIREFLKRWPKVVYKVSRQERTYCTYASFINKSLLQTPQVKNKVSPVVAVESAALWASVATGLCFCLEAQRASEWQTVCLKQTLTLQMKLMAFISTTHRFSPWLTCTWQGRDRVSLVVESIDEALGFCREWIHREKRVRSDTKWRGNFTGILQNQALEICQNHHTFNKRRKSKFLNFSWAV